MRQVPFRNSGPLIALAGLLITASTASALITRETALADLLKSSTYVVAARVDSLDPKRPAMILLVDEALRGKPSFKKMPMLLVGDSRAKKLKEQPELLRRLGVKMPVVMFISKRGIDYLGIVYSNGTWFSASGTPVDGELRWSWSHLEPYLRRTYKGTTKEMTEVVRDAVAGKRKPPAPNSKEKPGLGPEFGKKSSRLRDRPTLPIGEFAVVPTVFIGGPLALLAMLFPTVFGGWQRWLVLISTACTTSTLFTLQYFFQGALVGTWWGTPMALWVCMSVVNVIGLAWAWQRHLSRVQIGEAPLLASRIERLLLALVSLIGVATVLVCRWKEQPLLSPMWLPILALIVAFWTGTAYVLWTWARGPRLVPALGSETVILLGLVLASVGLTPALSSGGSSMASTTSEVKVDLVWTFRLPQAGAISSTPVTVGDRVYIAAAIDDPFSAYGTLYCLDRATGHVLWAFDDGKKMKQVHSTPVVVGNRIFVGEGFHQDFDCKVYCLSADGTKVWEYQTASHTESTPFVVGGRVYIGAGDDGIYCLDAETGKKQWNFPGFHIDAAPLVVGDRVYVGCGVGELYKQTVLFCLDAKNGGVIWRMPVDQPVWSRAVAAEGRLYVATGNGRLNESDDHPAGAVLCLSATNGQPLWKRKLPDGVLGRLLVDGKYVYAGCRDGCVHALYRADGEPAWKRPLGTPVVTTAAVEQLPDGSILGPLYVAGFDGLLACLDRRTGQPAWTKNLVERTQVPAQLISNPHLDVRREGGKEQRRLYLGVSIIGTARVGELHCYEESFVDS